jgi:hypothetical protein
VLETCLVETDTSDTDIVVATTHTPAAAGTYGDPGQTDVVVAAARDADAPDPPLGREDRKLMTAVVHKCEIAGKPARPVVILTEEPERALLVAVRDVGAEELLVGPSGAEAPDQQLDRLAERWREISGDTSARLTIRRIARDRDDRRDLGGGSRIPRASDHDGETARALEGVTVE